MISRPGVASTAVAAAVLILACRSATTTDRRSTSGPSASAEAARVAIEQPLPPLDGGRLRVALIEVTYLPGGSSPPHLHRCPVIGHVITGALRSRVEGDPEVVYRAGESFYEPGGRRHLVSANASDSAPVTFLAYFTCDVDGPRTIAAGPARATPADR